MSTLETIFCELLKRYLSVEIYMGYPPYIIYMVFLSRPDVSENLLSTRSKLIVKASNLNYFSSDLTRPLPRHPSEIVDSFLRLEW